MPTASFLHHKGARVLLVDYSHQKDPETTLRLYWENQAVLEAEPKGSVLLLVDVTGLRFDVRLSNAFREGAARSKPWCRAMAGVGVTGVMQVLHRGINRLLGRDIPDFPTREAALDWLAQQ